MTILRGISEDKATVTIEVCGRFDFSSRDEFEAAYNDFPVVGKHFVVDFGCTTYMDSSAMGLLLQLREYAAKRSGEVVLANGNEKIRTILLTANFQRLFEIN